MSVIQMRRSLPQKLRVLIAEDNEVNQLMAKGILRHWGIEAKVACTGLEVMSCMQQQDFDVVLMDIQMPEKSGVEAVKDIRKLKDENKKNTPIIALTANGMKGEEKKYLDAGTNAFLVKPFNEEQLFEVVDKVLEKRLTSISEKYKVITMDSRIIKPADTEKLYDMAQLEEIAAGNQDFIISLANIFLQTIPENSNDMVASAKSGNWDMTSKLAHKLKSTIDSMNMLSIKTDIRTIELDAKNKKNIESLPTLVEKVNRVIQQVALQLRADYNLT